MGFRGFSGFSCFRCFMGFRSFGVSAVRVQGTGARPPTKKLSVTFFWWGE